MIDVTGLVVGELIARIQASYHGTYGSQRAYVPEIVGWAAELALENIALSDALYHDVEHTTMVTLVGTEILRGRHLIEGGVSPHDWLHVVLSLLFHDIGYVRDILEGDRDGVYVTGTDEGTVGLPPGATDAALMPWHVDRGIRFVHERFGDHDLIDAGLLAANIGHTRFPVPDDPAYHDTDTYPGLCRAADLVGQLADPHYLRKIPALYHEFCETGMDVALGFEHAAQMRAHYPRFYERSVKPWVGDALRYLDVTARGRQWIANLHQHVYEVSRGTPQGPGRSQTPHEPESNP